MEEILIFTHKIVLQFSDLNDQLENTIYSRLSEEDFVNTTFEVLNIIEFNVKEMLVTGKTVVCKVRVKAICNNPIVGKIFDLTDFEIKGNKILSKSKNRIQIIADLNGCDVKSSYQIQIEAVKLVSKNILCVAKVLA